MNRLLILPLLISGCSTLSVTCEDMGVTGHGPERPIRLAQALDRERLEYACRNSPRTPGKELVGCTVEYIDGSVSLHWQEGNACAEMHERCHAEKGSAHSDKELTSCGLILTSISHKE